MEEYEKLKEKIIKFNEDRDWDQFHTPVNLAKSVAIEAESSIILTFIT